jgi:hypothetical protein
LCSVSLLAQETLPSGQGGSVLQSPRRATEDLPAGVSSLPVSPAGARPLKDAVFLAYARDYQLEMLVGQHDPSTHRWYQNTYPFIPPEVNTPFTLFGVTGRLSQVHLDDEFKTPSDTDPWAWYANINPWDRSVTHVALALSGIWPDIGRHPEALPLDDADSVAAVSTYLQEHHLQVAKPNITQVLRIDLNGDGNKEIVICANTDNATLKDDIAAPIYYLALLRANINGHLTTLPLRTATSFKPPNQSIDEHQRYHGPASFYQVLAFTDIERNGHEQIAILNDERVNGPEVDVFVFNGHEVSNLISARMLYF